MVLPAAVPLCDVDTSDSFDAKAAARACSEPTSTAYATTEPTASSTFQPSATA
jgi:hypothetical protein